MVAPTPLALLHRATPRNLALLPAALLAARPAWQPLADALPQGDVLILLPAAPAPLRQVLETVALLRAAGHGVRVVPADGWRTGRQAAATAAALADAEEEEEEERMLAAVAGFRAYARFVSIDVAHHRFRCYTLSWQPALFDAGAVRRSWGRLGGRGRTTASFHPDRDGAQVTVERLVRRRLRRGYRPVDWT